jgi:hypothetical protein
MKIIGDAFYMFSTGPNAVERDANKGSPRSKRNSPSFLALVDRELNGPVGFNENGKKQKIKGKRAMVRSTINKAINGDIRALKKIIALAERELAEPLEIIYIPTIPGDERIIMQNTPK